MATAARPVAAPPGITRTIPGRRYDHYFFSVIAALMLVTVVFGFGPSYYFVGAVRAPLPSTIIHIHGAVFSCWILLLIAQTSLAASGRVDVHRKLGIAGMIMVPIMLVLGILAATDTLARPPRIAGRDQLAFYVVPLVSVAAFVVLMYFAFRARRNSPAHKRFVLVANVSLMTAPIARMPFAFVHRKPGMAMLVEYTFILFLLAYDLWSTRKLQRSTVGAAAFLVVAQWGAISFSHTAAWHALALTAQTWGRAHLL